MNSQMKMHIGWGLEESLALELPSSWSWDIPLSQHMDVFTNPEALQILCLWDFYESFIV